MPSKTAALVLAVLVGSLAAPAAQADEASGGTPPNGFCQLLDPNEPTTALPCPTTADWDPFQAGVFSVELLSGYFPRADLGPRADARLNPAIDYLPQAFRVGLMCNDPCPDRLLLPGVFEVLLEYEYAPIVRSAGNYFTGPSALLRYNLALPGWHLVPYTQVGGGFVLTDAWKDPVQHVIGQQFEFLLRAEAGVHIMLTDHWSLNLEGGFQHISNADLAGRNDGLNSFGGAIGFTRYLGK